MSSVFQINAKQVTSSAVAMIGKDQSDNIWVLPVTGDWAYQYEHQFMSQKVLQVVDDLINSSDANLSIGMLWGEIKRPYAERGITSEKMERKEFLDVSLNKPRLKYNPSWLNQSGGLFNW